MGAYSKGGLIRKWGLNRSFMVHAIAKRLHGQLIFNICFQAGCSHNRVATPLFTPGIIGTP